MNYRFRHSIRFKIATIVFLTTLVTILISWSISNHFIEQFFITHTNNMLIQTYNSANEFFNDEVNTKQLKNDEIESLYGYIDNPSSSAIFVINPKNYRIYSSVNVNEDTSAGLISLVQNYDLNKFKYGNKRYTIVRNTFETSDDESEKESGNYYDLIGLLDNEYIIVLRASVDSVYDNVQFAARMFTSISFALLIFEILIVLIITNIFSRPIIEMSRIARKMSNMDFSSKVDVKTDDEIGELGESMNNMASSLEKSITELKSANLELSNDIRKREHIEEMRSEFLSHVSHELKTPLALIQGYAEGLKSGVADNPEDLNYYCDVISDEASKMNAMVMKLIDLDQLETGEDISLERFDITRLIQDVINNSSILLQDSKTKIIYNEKEELYVWADSFMIEEVITNYLTNAIHYVSPDGDIRIWFERKQDTVRVNVYNDGDNIPEEDINKLFIKFYKVDAARTRTYGGSGIGLSIVAAIMKSHDKDYGVYNAEHGVVFYFELDTKSTI
ncbi:Signal transduction histidine kinase [Lachnospiraceae bacterium NE2001]|nr:Signal transduction histidine kinase [Lachnospiraceae bacterium NE2001]